MTRMFKSKKLLAFGAICVIVLLFAGKYIRYIDTTSTQLGYGFWQKLLIVHVDDLGLSPSSNEAFLKIKQHNVINSASIIVTGTAYQEILEYEVKHPEFDW